MASLRASKTSFLLAMVSQAPSPAPRMSNKVSCMYLHEERWQLQVHARAGLYDPPGKIVCQPYIVAFLGEP